MGKVSSAGLTPPEPLSADHQLDEFESGIASLDEWLRHRAAANQVGGASRTFVLCSNKTVVGYYSLAASSIAHNLATSKVRRNMPDPVPAVIIGRLAIDRRWQGKGLGGDLLRDAVLRATTATETIGVRAILVHAMNNDAKSFYEHFGFRVSPAEPLTLMATIDDIRRAVWNTR